MKKFLLVVLALAFSVCAFGQTETITSNFSSPEGRGAYKIYTCANPAAGAEFTCTVPVGKIWRLVSLNVSLVTSATVATRAASITYDDGTSAFYSQTCNATQAASLTYTYSVSNPSFAGGATANIFNIPTPNESVRLGPGYRIRSATTAIQAGDDYGAPVLLVEEWVK